MLKPIIIHQEIHQHVIYRFLKIFFGAKSRQNFNLKIYDFDLCKGFCMEEMGPNSADFAKKKKKKFPDCQIFAKKNYGKNSKNISLHKNIIFKKFSQKKIQNSSRYYNNSIISNTRQIPTKYQGIF